MHTLVLCLWLLSTVLAADEESQRPVYIISQNGSPPGYSNGQPFFGESVSSNNVKVLPNAYRTPEDANTSGVTTNNPISVPVIVNRNTPFQGNLNQPIPVPVSYTDDGSTTIQSQPAFGTNSLPIQSPPPPGVTPVPVLVKAPASAYRAAFSTPSPFKARTPESTNENNSENPYSAISPTFRLWPKLPEPVPVPVLAADAFVRNSIGNLNTNNNLIPQYLQQLPIPNNAPTSSNGYQQNAIPARYPDSSQFQTQPNQSGNQGPIYIIVPGGSNNGQFGSYQPPSQTQTSYQSQAPQSGNQGFIIVVPPSANAQSNQAYQNYRDSSNINFENQLQSQFNQQQSPLNYAVVNPSNGLNSQTQIQSSQQAPLNFPVFAPSNTPGSQSQTLSNVQQSALKYAIFGPASTSGKSTDSAGQALLSSSAFLPQNSPGSLSSNAAGQPSLIYPVFGPPNDGSRSSSSTLTPSPFVGYSSTQSPQQNAGFYALTQSPQYTGYSSTAAPIQTSYSQSTSASPVSFAPQYNGFSSSTQSPQYDGYSSTPAPPQTSYSQPTPISQVRFFSGSGNYSYSV